MKSKLIILSIATLLGCVSCNTIGGVGKDVKAASSGWMKRLSGKKCAAARMS